jgi:hypothetical protein
MYVPVASCRVALRRPPARILHGHASGEESIDDIVRALENGTVRDLHVRELDLSGTKPFREGLLRIAPAGAFHFATDNTTFCNRTMWRPLAFSQAQVGV